MRLLDREGPEDLAPEYAPKPLDERAWAQREVVLREGQGAFRVRVLDAYGRRCAVTGERSLPVLDAAHIQPYYGPAANHVQNGLVLRADLHRLFDGGYLTVTPEYRLEVSRRLKEEYENGKEYYRMNGLLLPNIPAAPSLKPSKTALEWHAANIFR
jgi:putative restriction endonuclease